MGVEASYTMPEQRRPLIDSALTLEEALQGKEIPQEIVETLAIVPIRYRSFDGFLHEGQLVVHQDVAVDVMIIFEELLRHNFPVEVSVPVSQYGWDDESSMQANNTSAFNYRTIAGTERLSNHARGLAIDINPRINPCISGDGTVQPEGATYDPKASGALHAESEAVQIFKRHGWTWGGDWTDPKDWQHFEKA